MSELRKGDRVQAGMGKCICLNLISIHLANILIFIQKGLICESIIPMPFHIILHLISPDGIIVYSAVRAFLKIKQTEVTMYKSIKISGNKTIGLTANHLIYSRKCFTDKFNPK